MQGSADFQPNHRVIDAFVQWIEQPHFNPLYAKQWGQRYNDNPEAAMCEASFWAVLDDCGITVEPNPNTTPDFLCMKDGEKFYVEVTCIQIDTVTRKTHLKHIPEDQAMNFKTLNDAIRGECINKTAKCANLDAPCVLGVGTFHFHASAIAVSKTFIEMLHTDTCIGLNFDPRAGRIVGEPYQVARRRKAAFTRLSDVGGVEPIRRPISALLVGGFGCDPPSILGLLNPTPARQFDPRLLERIPFCVERTDLLKAEVSVEWIQTSEQNATSRFVID